MNKRLLFYLSFVCLALQASCAPVLAPEPSSLFQTGWLEQVSIGDKDSGIIMHAKLDSGADSCSIHAEDKKISSEGDQKYMTFTLTNRYGQRERVKHQIIRFTKIKTKAGGTQLRPVIIIGVCLADRFEAVECNLVDRSNFEYPVLVGRNMLAGNALVNSSETYLTKPSCQ